MQINLESNHSLYAIRSYGPGMITVNIPLGREDPSPDALDAIGPELGSVPWQGQVHGNACAERHQ